MKVGELATMSGAFDFLSDERHEAQVQCFYRPIFSDEAIFGSYTMHSGGTFKRFQEGDILPLKTLYYEYPEDFCIVLASLKDEYEIALVEDGRFSGFIKDVVDVPEYIKNFYSVFGTKIKANNRYDIKKYIEENKKMYEQDKDSREYLEFGEKWLIPLTLEQELGELVECYLWHQENKGDKLLKEHGVIQHTSILLAIKEFAQHHSDVFASFLDKNKISF